MDPTSEAQRLRRAATEVVQTSYSRLTLLRTCLLQLLEVRDIASEVRLLMATSKHVRSSGNYLSAMMATFGNAAALRNWYPACGPILSSLRIGKNSASQLSRRNLGRLERLLLWIGGSLDGVDNAWKPGETAAR